jgi:UDP-N-acetylmuramate dehydrogenase
VSFLKKIPVTLTKEIREALAATVKGELSWNVPMADRTTIRVGGPADCVFAPKDAEDLSAFVQLARRFKLPYDVLGAGSNLIVKDGGFRGVLVDLAPHFDAVEKVDDLHLKAGGGVPLPTVVARAREWGMGGAEKVCGIPGQVGGSVAMNAGTKDGEMSQVLSGVTVVDKTGRVKSLERAQVPFEYRSFGLDKGTVVVEATFGFEKADPKELAKKIDDSKSKRKASQPLDIPNAGCAFKNVVDPKSGKTRLHAGRVIEELGLKGVRIRGAQISDVHANFIVNVGNATAKDVLALVALVRDKVKEAHGVALESEWRVIGEEPPEESDED